MYRLALATKLKQRRRASKLKQRRRYKQSRRRASKLEAQAKAQAKNGLEAQATDYPDVGDTESNYPDYPDDQGNPLALVATETIAHAYIHAYIHTFTYACKNIPNVTPSQI